MKGKTLTPKEVYKAALDTRKDFDKEWEEYLKQEAKRFECLDCADKDKKTLKLETTIKRLRGAYKTINDRQLKDLTVVRKEIKRLEKNQLDKCAKEGLRQLPLMCKQNTKFLKELEKLTIENKEYKRKNKEYHRIMGAFTQFFKKTGETYERAYGK